MHLLPQWLFPVNPQPLCSIFGELFAHFIITLAHSKLFGNGFILQHFSLEIAEMMNTRGKQSRKGNNT